MSLPAEKKPKEIALNDREQIQYLFGNPPSWMMRYGISTMAGFFVLLLALSYVIHYPNVIEAKITLTTANPPIRVMTQIGGRISDLLVAANQPVEQGQILAVIENPARWQDALRLEIWCQKYTGQQDSLPSRLELGDLQDAWSAFSQHWKDYLYFSSNGHTADRIALLQDQIAQLEKINANLMRQKTILQEEFALMTKERSRQRQLQSQQVISDVEAEKTEANWLQQKRQIESANATMLQNQMQIKQLDNQIVELRLKQYDDENAKALTLMEDMQRLRSAVETWKQNYLIIAPIAGSVSLAKVWSAQQSVASGEEILAVVPRESGEASGVFVGKASVTGVDIGKVKPGSRVVIRLDAYPAQQYGTLEGMVANIAALPQAEGYAMDIVLSDSLITSYGQTIPFRQEMSGQARIITEERRVIERIFDRIRDLLKNR
jgi:multidrug resistance efflux pump